MRGTCSDGRGARPRSSLHYGAWPIFSIGASIRNFRPVGAYSIRCLPMRRIVDAKLLQAAIRGLARLARKHGVKLPHPISFA